MKNATLDKNDLKSLAEAAKRTAPLIVPLSQTLSYCSCLRRRDHQMRLRMKAVNRFDEMLDVRAFVRTNINLSLLVSMIMTREQAFLFQHHRARALSI